MKKLIFTAMLCAGIPAVAQDSNSGSSALQFSREATEKAPEGFIPYLGLGGGYTGYDSASQVEGSPAALKILASYYLQSPWVFDLGYGVSNQQFIQSAGTDNTAQTGGVLEFAARYNFLNKWQGGVVANQLFQQGADLTADQGDAHFVGLQVLREFAISDSWLARLGARAQALTNNTSGQVSMYMVDVQLGWNPNAYRDSVRSSTAENSMTSEQQNELSQELSLEEPSSLTTLNRSAVEVEPASTIQEVSYSALAGGTAIRFPAAQSEIASSDRNKVKQLAQALKDNADLFESVEVRGFTDSSGPMSVNQEISLQRAESVKGVLQNNGLSQVDIVAVGRGSQDLSGVRAQDRRAEIVFIGVKDEAKLQEILSKVE